MAWNLTRPKWSITGRRTSGSRRRYRCGGFRCVERGEIKRDGSGTKTDPFCYWLPSLEEKWRTDSFAHLREQVAEADCRSRRLPAACREGAWNRELKSKDREKTVAG